MAFYTGWRHFNDIKMSQQDIIDLNIRTSRSIDQRGSQQAKRRLTRPLRHSQTRYLVTPYPAIIIISHKHWSPYVIRQPSLTATLHFDHHLFINLFLDFCFSVTSWYWDDDLELLIIYLLNGLQSWIDERNLVLLTFFVVEMQAFACSPSTVLFALPESKTSICW